MTIPSITPTPISPPASPPTRDDPDNFRERADEFVDWQADTFPDEIDAFITDMNATITEMNLVSAQVDVDAIDSAGSSAVALAAANFHGEWDELSAGTANIP